MPANTTEIERRLLPEFATQIDFGERVRPLRDVVVNLGRRNANLRRTRDLLLPRLVSGELDVSALNVRGPGLEAPEAGQEREGAVA